LTKEGVLYLNGEPSDDAGVVRSIATDLPKNPDLQAIIAADKVVPTQRGPPDRSVKRAACASSPSTWMRLPIGYAHARVARWHRAGRSSYA